jgi:hypothetical protein
MLFVSELHQWSLAGWAFSLDYLDQDLDTKRINLRFAVLYNHVSKTICI